MPVVSITYLGSTVQHIMVLDRKDLRQLFRLPISAALSSTNGEIVAVGARNYVSITYLGSTVQHGHGQVAPAPERVSITYLGSTVQHKTIFTTFLGG